MKDIVATRRFPYGGQYCEIGGVYSVPDRFAKLIVAIGKAKNYVPAPVDQGKPEAEPKKRTYKRKAKADEAEPKKRAYKRKDMRAETE